MIRTSTFLASALAAAAPALAGAPIPRAPTDLPARAITRSLQPPAVPSVKFRGIEYFPRSSDANQYQFTPAGQENLNTFRDMLTVVLDPRAQDAAGLTQYANQLVATYKQNKGVIVRTVAVPATAQKPGEYFVAAMLPGPNVMEFAAARLILVGKEGAAVVYSHRYYGDTDADSLGHWVQSYGPDVETELLKFDAARMVSSVKR